MPRTSTPLQAASALRAQPLGEGAAALVASRARSVTLQPDTEPARCLVAGHVTPIDASTTKQSKVRVLDASGSLPGGIRLGLDGGAMKGIRVWTRWRTLVAAAVIGFTGSVAAGGSAPGGTAAVPAAGSVDNEQYLVAVLALMAESTKRDPRADIGGRWLPGPLAVRHMHEGMSMTSAISLARDAGESASFVPNDRVRARQLLMARGGW